MSGIAILCSGQGAQAAGMFDIIGRAEAAAPVFAAARALLAGRDPRGLVQEAGDDVLHQNRTAQLLCCIQALAWWAVLSPAAPRPLTVAGYSAGELAAWGVAGALPAPAVLALAARRAELMDEAAKIPAGMAAILGLPCMAVEGLCRRFGLYLAIANGPDHFVIAGPRQDLHEALAEAVQEGAHRATLLPVAVASHTPLLRAASLRFDRLLAAPAIGAVLPPGTRLLSGIDGRPVRRVEEGLHKLALQVGSAIDWQACLDSCQAARPQRVLELGPGGALARMMAEAFPEIPVRSVTAFRSVAAVQRWLCDPG